MKGDKSSAAGLDNREPGKSLGFWALHHFTSWHQDGAEGTKQAEGDAALSYPEETHA